jgi:hypothetical protein
LFLFIKLFADVPEIADLFCIARSTDSLVYVEVASVVWIFMREAFPLSVKITSPLPGQSRIVLKLKGAVAALDKIFLGTRLSLGKSKS